MARRSLHICIIAATAACLASAWAIPTSSAAVTATAWNNTTQPANSGANDHAKNELGVRFQPVTSGAIKGVRFYKDAKNTGTHTATLWSAQGTAMATATFANETGSGWQTAYFAKPVSVNAGTTYVASYSAPNGGYAYDYYYFTKPAIRGNLKTPRNAGVFRYGGGFPTDSFRASNYWVDVVFGSTNVPPSSTSTSSTSTTSTTKPTTTIKPTTTSTTPPVDTTPTGWPDASNTGPNTASLPAYTGSCDVHENNVTIDSKTITCSMLLYGTNLTIKNSVVNGTIMINSNVASVTIQDSIVNAGNAYQGAIQGERVTVLRSEITGGEHGVLCGDNCTVRDSYIHDLYDGRSKDWHQNGILSNGGNGFTIVHNTVKCNGGCTGDISFINDGDLSNGTISNNLLMASPDASFCAYPMGGTTSKSGKSTNMVWTNNVFQRGANKQCGLYGPVYDLVPGNGNSFTGNTWDDGSPLNG